METFSKRAQRASRTESKGKLIVNSKKDGQSNIGYPYAPHEVDWFIVMLKKAAPAVTKAELDAIKTKLRSYKRQA